MKSPLCRNKNEQQISTGTPEVIPNGRITLDLQTKC